MPELSFDGKRVSVPDGTNLVEVGLRAGVPVPVFCYHKDLGAVGSCRVCAVSVTTGDQTRTVMACMTAALDGMEVTTLDPASTSVRRWVTEWLMVNHPHDCPICDEGGECQLQDLTIACGHSQRRYHGPKRTFHNQQLGEFIVHEMNRCIACYRCSRFYQEYAGGRDFAVSGSRDRVYFGRFEDGPLESPFSGNLIELCPTGVFTDKLFRYTSRVWDLEIAPSICPHCSVGCNVHPGARHRALQRVRVRENEAVNGVFLCDRGQFGHRYVMDPERPLTIRLNGAESDWDDALGTAGGLLLGIARDKGAGAIALITSPRASLETHAALESLATGPLAGARVCRFDDPEREPRALAALGALAEAQLPPLELSDLGACDVLLVAGASLVDEAPVAALAARQVARRGGRVIVMNAGERYLNDVAEVVPTHPGELAARLGQLAAGLSQKAGNGKAAAPAAGNGAQRSAEDALRDAATALGAAKRPGVLVGSDLVDGAAIRAAAGLARALAKGGVEPRLGFLFPGPNGFGAAARAQKPELEALFTDLASGRIAAAVVAEADLTSWAPEHVAALLQLELLVVLDYVTGPLAAGARVFLPTTATYESDGVYVNRAGRAQAFAPARRPGLSVIQLIDQETFPRQPGLEPPLGQARPAWWALELMRERALGAPTARTIRDLRRAIAQESPFWAVIRDIQAGDEGHPLDAKALGRREAEVPAFHRGDGLGVFHMDRTLGSEPLSARSQPVRTMAGPPVAVISPADHQRLGANGWIRIELGGREHDLRVQPRASVPPGVLLVPRDATWSVRTAQGAAAKVVALETAKGAPS